MAGDNGFGLTCCQLARVCQFLGIGLNGVEIGDLFRATDRSVDQALALPRPTIVENLHLIGGISGQSFEIANDLGVRRDGFANLIAQNALWRWDGWVVIGTGPIKFGLNWRDNADRP